MWEALGRGPLLRAILTDFYAEVFQDPRLLPFFHATTREWVIDHQYAFLAEIFTGERMFFGDRPRNAHHWMVITDDLFDYLALDAGGACDGCAGEIPRGADCWYHVRTGKAFCAACAAERGIIAGTVT
jgi:truncated hemoglobin YjbI